VSRVEYRKCDNCEQRLPEGVEPITVSLPNPDAQAKGETTHSPSPWSIQFVYLGGVTTPRDLEFEFCSPRCVVAAFIAAGAITNEVTFK
jgi:hypothetical protein